MNIKELIITTLLSALLTLGGSVVIWECWLKPPTLVSFDLKGTTDQFLVQSAKLNLSNEQRDALLGRFNRKLTLVIDRWSAEHHQLVIVRPAAVSGVEDVTPQIRHELALAMKDNR
ncbi:MULTISPECIES: TrbI F-type domain-containing protein [Serratia]|jgi:conjugal transfer pilin signal peptidase TrbI|uniref:TrbI F-type domain-containing protein n=1 Tax=Serratia TaxID=613 RepID=UPI0003DFCFB7|nr:TrbI F-type domain-containing protein [Serratia marcescens]HBQ7493294.1 TrbI F-type domain-containing protein [Klebsiella pneumoniae]EIG9090280.1 TrbI F-type domain-containing protein [Serratia marcescens]CAI1963606.1 conjugal transfer protein TrbI [Serratia marcescens]BAO37015.1 conjugative transfer system protein TrbI [Serratia marcescens SM39]HCR2979562.1 TrbI F-type domain-containing protein [Serratia marcescens]